MKHARIAKYLRLRHVRTSGWLITDGMSWRSHGRNNTELVDALKRNGIVKSATVEEAMKAIDRGGSGNGVAKRGCVR